jgi:RimJ/RimL family protein N-acetyltransferase
MNFDHYTIRQLTMDDLHDYFNLIESNRKRLEDFFAGTVAITRTLEGTKTHLSDVLEKAGKNDYFPFIVVDNDSGKIIASIQVKSLDWNIPKGELGYYIDAKYEGKGVVTKAVSMIIDHCFKQIKLNKLFIRTFHENKASIQVAEKNGFILEGTIRSDYKTTSGKLVDLLYYGLLREEWTK